MVQAAKKCTESKRSFNVVVNPRVTQTIKLVRLEEYLHLAPDLSTAIGKLSALPIGFALTSLTFLPMAWVLCN